MDDPIVRALSRVPGVRAVYVVGTPEDEWIVAVELPTDASALRVHAAAADVMLRRIKVRLWCWRMALASWEEWEAWLR